MVEVRKIKEIIIETKKKKKKKNVVILNNIYLNFPPR